MKRENILELARIVERSKVFSQHYWTHECGTPACIAGHAAWASLRDKGKQGERPERSSISRNGIRERACRWLGFENDDHRTCLLFTARPFDDGIMPTRRVAAQVLRNLAETGKVDWDAARRNASFLEQVKMRLI